MNLSPLLYFRQQKPQIVDNIATGFGIGQGDDRRTDNLDPYMVQNITAGSITDMNMQSHLLGFGCRVGVQFDHMGMHVLG